MFIFIRIKKDKDQGKEGVTLNYDEHKKQWKSKINTQHVPLRQNTEDKVRGKESEEVWDDEKNLRVFIINQ